MIGGNKAPFRLPCAGSEAGALIVIKTVTGSVTPIPTYGNTTQMVDHCGNTVTPVERFYPTDTCGDDVCTEPDCSDCPGGTNLIGNTPEPPKISENTFVHIGDILPDLLQPVPRVGGKWVQAFKAWQGMFGFTYNTDGTLCTSGALSNNRFRTITYDTHIRDTHMSNGVQIVDFPNLFVDKTGARTVAKNSGVITQPTFVTTEDDIEDLADGNGPQSSYYCSCGAGYVTEYGGAHDPFSSGGTTLLDAIDNNFQCTYPKVVPNWINEGPSVDLGDLAAFITLWNDGKIDIQFDDSYSTFTGGTLPAITDPDSYSGSASGTTNSGNTSWSVSLEFTRTETGVTWDFTLTKTLAPGDPEVGHPVIHTYHYYGTVTLSDVYSIVDVLIDAALLTTEWSLTNHSKYPFRTDTHTTVAPFVYRNEVSPPASPAGFQTCDWVDPHAADFDGAIIGGPLPAGYGQAVGGNPRGVFDKDHENFFRRNCVLGVGWTQANESRGGFTPSYLPANTQKWTDDFQATSLFPSAFANADINGVYLQKWCEIPIKRPSINFARPYGPDKFALDETVGQVFYVSNIAGSVVTLQNLDFSAVSSLPFTGADIVGNAALGGFYAVASVGSNTVTLGSKVYDLPAGWQTPSNDAHFCFGKLRFPNAPGMDFIDTTAEVGGRVAVTVSDGTTQTNIATATVQKYLSLGVNPETVDILDANLVPLATSVDLVRDTDSTFHVATAFATIATAKWIVPHVLNDGSTSGQKFKLADSRSKGDYVVRSWTVRISDGVVLATTQTDACLADSPCGTAFVGISPNAELSPGAYFWDFPTTINNGEIWIADVQFWRDDPFWQQPHTPCAVNDSHAAFTPGVDQILWAEDDGTCNTNSMEVGGGGERIYHRFYPMRPFVEARCTLPTNIDGETPPALASGTDLAAVVDHPNRAGIGDVDGPLVNAIILRTPTWSKYLSQRACVLASGTFAADYIANGTTA